jgi:hypothetical protein
MSREEERGMMTWDAAERLFTQIEAAVSGSPELEELEEDLVLAAVSYARIRTDWEVHSSSRSDVDSREAHGAHRTSTHNAFIIACHVLARAMQQRELDASWREELGQDRKRIGDWACYIHGLLGLRAR